MKLVEIDENRNFDFLKVRIYRKFNPRTVNVRGSDTVVCDMLIKDDTHHGKLTLWGDGAADDYDLKQIVKITNGWAKIWNNQVQISLGKNGKLEKLDDDPSIPE